MMNDAHVTQAAPPGAIQADAKPQLIDSPRLIDSKVLLAGRQELNIRHGGDAYVLRVTKNGKLLLTK